MPMINRLTRLFRADMHAVLDGIEEPDLLLRQALREMEEALSDGTRKLELDRQQRDALARRSQEISTTLTKVDEELELCLSVDNEALARVLLRRRLEGERLLAHLQRQASRLEVDITHAQQSLEKQRAQFEQLRAQAQAQTPSTDAAGFAGPWSAEQFSVSDADVELALLRARRGRA